jgi:hypothetical protein
VVGYNIYISMETADGVAGTRTQFALASYTFLSTVIEIPVASCRYGYSKIYSYLVSRCVSDSLSHLTYDHGSTNLELPALLSLQTTARAPFTTARQPVPSMSARVIVLKPISSFDVLMAVLSRVTAMTSMLCLQRSVFLLRPTNYCLQSSWCSTGRCQDGCFLLSGQCNCW